MLGRRCSVVCSGSLGWSFFDPPAFASGALPFVAVCFKVVVDSAVEFFVLDVVDGFDVAV